MIPHHCRQAERRKAASLRSDPLCLRPPALLWFASFLPEVRRGPESFRRGQTRATTTPARPERKAPPKALLSAPGAIALAHSPARLPTGRRNSLASRREPGPAAPPPAGSPPSSAWCRAYSKAAATSAAPAPPIPAFGPPGGEYDKRPDARCWWHVYASGAWEAPWATVTGRFAVSAVSWAALTLRIDSPESASRWALWTRRSRMASASVGSARYSCQLSTGSWLVTSVL